MFFHVLSCSFIFLSFFFHFLFLCWVLNQNLINLGLNFVTISLDSSYVENHFLGSSRGVETPPLGPLFLLFLFFCSFFFFFFFFFVFFLLLIFPFFHFCSFLHFFDFLMVFHFLFSIFRRKSFFFSFFLYFFQRCFIAGISIRV